MVVGLTDGAKVGLTEGSLVGVEGAPVLEGTYEGAAEALAGTLVGLTGAWLGLDETGMRIGVFTFNAWYTAFDQSLPQLASPLGHAMLQLHCGRSPVHVAPHLLN